MHNEYLPQLPHRRRPFLALSLLIILMACSRPTPHPTISPSPTVRPTAVASALKDTQAPLIPEVSEMVFRFHDGKKVAFNSLSFIDLQADVLTTITFDTLDARALQNEGWSGSETLPGVGKIQWAGGNKEQAVLHVQIPANTEGMFLQVASKSGVATFDVTLNGISLGSLRVTDQWQVGYLSISDFQPSIASTQTPQWSDGRYFPLFPPPADRVYSIRIRPAFENWQGKSSWRFNQNEDAMLALTLVGMQGLINRGNPSIYLDWSIEGPYGNESHAWLPVLHENVNLIELDLDGLSAIRFLYRRYSQYLKGAVIYDPAIADSVNLATMYAGLENRLILSPEQLDLPGIHKFSDVVDLRQLAQEQGWDSSAESKYRLYEWIYENLWPNLDHRIIGIISPGAPSSLCIPADSYLPPGLAARDYIISLQLSALWLSPSEEPESGLLRKFLTDAPHPIPLLGFYNCEEGNTVALAAQLGDWVPVITNGNAPVSSGSLSLFSSIQPMVQRNQSVINPDHILATLKASHIATIYTSDGDSLQVLLDQGFGNFPWKDVHGYHIGWGINPVLAELAPLVWNYYMGMAGETSFLTGVSGAGYTHPAAMNDEQLRSYLAYTARYLDDTGLRSLEVMSGAGSHGEGWDRRLSRIYYEVLHDKGYLGVFPENGILGLWGLGFRYQDAPAPAVYTSYDASCQDLDWIVENLVSKRPGEIYMDLPDYPHVSDVQVVDDPEAHAGKALLFSTAASLGAVQGPFGTLPPGEYTVTFRLKVADNQDSRPMVRIYIGSTKDTGQVFANQLLAPADFQIAEKYQEFTLTFSIDQMVDLIEIGISHFGGTDPPEGDWASEDLYADKIHLSRVGGLNLPVFAGIIEIATSPAKPENMDIIEKLEQAGVLVLSPDEFVAALNPEYMIEFAAPILGSENPVIAQAGEYIDQGEYLEALLVIRSALSERIE